MMAIKMPGKKQSPEEFISGATAVAPSRAPGEEYPWHMPMVRDDLRVQLNAKLPERLMVKVDWLSRRLGVKKQDMIETALREWAQARLRELGIEDE